MFADNNGSGMYMPVAPAFGYGGGGFGGGIGFGGDWAWILLLLVLGGGWGGFGMGGGMWPMMMGGAMGADFGLYPWLNNSEHISDGFRDQQLQTSVSSIGDRMSAGFGDVQLGIAGLGRQVCETGSGITGAVRDAAAQAEIAANGRQMASMQQAFAAQTAQAQGFNGLQSQLAQCCCENRLAAADNKYTIATEAANTRFADANNTRDIIDSQTRGTQAILDKLCALELDNVKSQLAAAQRENLGLQNAVNMAAMRESQTAQTAQILAGQAAEIDGVYNRLKNCPVGTTPVYGNQPIFTCGNNVGCGCGCGVA